MHGSIAWFAKNAVAANLLMVFIIFIGLYSILTKIPLEVFPSFEIDVINVTTSYPGASPEEVEKNVTLKIEDAVADMPEIDHLYSTASEGSSRVRIELSTGQDKYELLNDIKSRIDSIDTFPEDVKNSTVSIQKRSRETITVMLYGDTSETMLYEQANLVRDELAATDGISQVEINGLRPREIRISISREMLERHNLSFNQVATLISRNNIDVPAGTLAGDEGDVLLRVMGQSKDAEAIAQTPIIARNDGNSVLLGEIANISSDFSETPMYSMFDGQPAVAIEVYQVGLQSAIKVAALTRDYIEKRSATLPHGVKLSYWRDRSTIVKARLNTLLTSAWQGMLLIFIILALFLRPSVAFWVSVGIPISFLGTLITMNMMGMTMNIVSMFGFILVLGIVVDDAIVTGENIYSHLGRDHANTTDAVIAGTQEISVPVTFGVLTTVAAFLPLLFIDGARGQIFAQIPMVVIPVLLFSLIESKLILPAHMRHIKRQDKAGKKLTPSVVAQGLKNFVENIYQPTLTWCLRNRYAVWGGFWGAFIIAVSLVMTGHFKFTFFPKIPSEQVRVTIQMPTGTPWQQTEQVVQKVYRAAKKLQDEHLEPNGEPVIQHIMLTMGSTGSSGVSKGQSNLARVRFAVKAPELRDNKIDSRELQKQWMKLIGPTPEVDKLSFRSEIGRGGSPVDIQLQGYDNATLELASSAIKDKLANSGYEGISQIEDTFANSMQEVQFKLKPLAYQLGFNTNEVGRQIRNALYGLEAQKISDPLGEIPVVVILPKAERSNIDAIKQLQLQSPSGRLVELSQVAHINVGKGLASISRFDQKRTLNIRAEIDKKLVDANALARDINRWVPEILKDYPSVTFNMEGEQKEQAEFRASLMVGFVFSLLVIYTLLAIPFGSYAQPLIVMSVIPFSFVGALIGHAIMGHSLSISSMMGLLALTGVVVNDSLVLVDYTNKRIKEGMPLMQAITHAGGARFRPILLTSLTTFCGLLPIMFEQSTQAQFLIPMAISLGFGILFATFITLIAVPTIYLIMDDAQSVFRRLFHIKASPTQADR